MIKIVTLFFIVSTLIIVNFAAFLVYSSKFEFVSSKTMPGAVFDLIASLAICEFISFVAYSILIFFCVEIITNDNTINYHFYCSFFIAPQLPAIVIYLVLLLSIFYRIIIKKADKNNFTLIELLFPFVGAFYYVGFVLIFKNFLSSNKILKNNKKYNDKNTINHSIINFSTAIDNVTITSNKGKQLLSDINSNLIPKYNEARNLIKEAMELDDNSSSVVKLEDNLIEIRQRIKNKALQIKDAELELNKNKLNKKIDLFNKSLE